MIKRNYLFLIQAWNKEELAIWRDNENTSLSFLENLMIGVASDVFVDILLNSYGVNR